MAKKIRKDSRAYNELSIEHERKATEEEVSEQLGWTVDEVRTTMEAMPDATSLNKPLSSEEDSSELGNLLEDEQTSDTVGEVIREMESTELREAIEQLPERQRYVLVHRYGLGGLKPCTLAELGEELEISRERVRQLQREGEQMLKSGERSRALPRCNGVITQRPTKR
jgi:RNA polymerase primary sigma factor